MSLSGNFETFYLNSILQLLHNEKKTGVFRAKKNEDEVTIYFNDGAVIYAMGSQPESRLGNLALREGLISIENLKACLPAAKEKKQALGKYLVENDYISVEDLEKLLAKQTEKIIFNLFLWNKGDFEYKDVKLSLKGMVNVRLNVLKIILEASRRLDEISIFQKLITSDEMVFRLSEEIKDKEEIKLDASELQMLTLVDGQKTVREVFTAYSSDRAATHDEFTVYKILHSLITSGLVEESGDDQPDTETKSGEIDYSAIITVYNEVLQIACRHLETELGNKMYGILDETKSEVVSRPKDVFKGFDPHNPAATNIHSVLKAVEGYEEEKEVKALLIESFNEFAISILNKAVNIIGIQLTRDMLQEIEKILYDFKQHQFNTAAMHHFIDNINSLLQNTQKQVEDKIK
jgi:hypothetical protein